MKGHDFKLGLKGVGVASSISRESAFYKTEQSMHEC